MPARCTCTSEEDYVLLALEFYYLTRSGSFRDLYFRSLRYVGTTAQDLGSQESLGGHETAWGYEAVMSSAFLPFLPDSAVYQRG